MLESLGLMPAQASTFAFQVDLLYGFLLLVTAFFSLLIAGFVIFFSVKYRRRSEDERTPHIHGSTALEITWSIIPFGICMIMFFWGAHLFITLKRPPAVYPKASIPYSLPRASTPTLPSRLLLP